MRRPVALLAAAVALSACGSSDITGGTSDINPPENLTYQLIPSGDPTTPEGIMLRWDPVDDSRVTNYVVYSRGSSGEQWSRRAETTSASFNDLGYPDLQYQVASEADDGSESAPSNTVTVDASNTLITPGELSSITLNAAVWLSWPADSRVDAPGLFDYYRVYSTLYDLDQNVCDANWVLEGTTVSEDFLASGLPNGVPRCFAVSAISRDGHESDWTAPRSDTPRPDARNVLIFASQVDLSNSGFTFRVPSSGELGVVAAGNRSDIDFRVDRESDGSLWLVPVRTGTVLALYSSTDPLDDLTSIDLAPPDDEFSTDAIEAVPGYGYVFRTLLDGQYHYAGLRVTNVSSDYIIVDWSYQRDPGNPELSKGGGR